MACKHLPALLLIAPLLAQAFEFRVLSFQGDISDLALRNGREVVGITASEDTLSRPYAHTGSIPIELYAAQAGVSDTADRQPVARIPLPDHEMANAILVLARTPTGGYAGRWINDAQPDNPANTLSIHNFTGLALTMQSGETRWQQAPGDTRNLPFDSTKRQLPLRVATLTDQGWRLLLATPVPVRKNYRIHLILRPPTETDLEQNCALSMAIIPDYMPEPIGH